MDYWGPWWPFEVHPYIPHWVSLSHGNDQLMCIVMKIDAPLLYGWDAQPFVSHGMANHICVPLLIPADCS